MNTNSNWYVITGAPCSGKTKVIEGLAALGYTVTPEAPRIIINNEIKKGKTAKEVRANEAEFQKKALQMKIEIENKLSPEEITFLDDGGIPSSIAYYQIAGLDPDPAIEEAKKRRYGAVFFLERLPLEADYARIEDEKTVSQLDKLLYQSYLNLGYDVVRVPAKPVEERVKFILKKIKSIQVI